MRNLRWLSILPFVVVCLVCLVGLASPGLRAAELGRLSFTLPTTMPENETVTVEVAWPCNEDGTPAATAQDLVYYAPWWNEKKFAKGGVFTELAKEFTTVGIFLDDNTLPANAKRSQDPSSGSYEVIQRALAETVARLGLPVQKPFGCGHSSGASLLYWAALDHPEAFDAIAPIAGRIPRRATPPAIPTLHVYTFGDASLADNGFHWYRQSMATSTLLTPDPMWQARTNPIWLHLNSQESIRLTVAWLRGVADVRAAHAGVLPPMAEWPVQVPAERVAATAETMAIGQRAFPNQAVADRFAAAHRKIIRESQSADACQITRVVPRLGFDRTVLVLIAPQRTYDEGLYDAVLIAGTGAQAIAVQGSTAAQVAALAAAQTGDVVVIAPAMLADQLTALPASVQQVILDPQSPVAPGIMAIQVEAIAKLNSDPVMRHQQFLQVACAQLAKR